MATTFSISNSTVGVTRSITITDAETTLAADALNNTVYAGLGLTRAQALTRWFGEKLGDLKAIVDGYGVQTFTPPTISPQG